MVKQIKQLRITHIDNGAEPLTSEDVAGMVFEDKITGRWPKVSFNNGETLSWTWITNTKIVFFNRDNRDVITNDDYAELIREFMKSDRKWDENNWRSQKKRVSTWHPNTEFLNDRVLA